MRNKAVFCALRRQWKGDPKMLLSSAKMLSNLSYKMFSFCLVSFRFQGALLYCTGLSVYGEESSRYVIVKLDHTLTMTQTNKPTLGKYASSRHTPERATLLT